MDLKQLYTDPKFSASYAGKARFTKALKHEYGSSVIKQAQVDKTLKKIDSYTLHKPTKRTKLYRRIYSKGIGYLYQIDLVDMQKFSRKNDGFNWLITCIDTFSKKAWVFSLKNKTGILVTNALKELLEKNKPQKIEIDRGTEFYNRNFLKLLRDNNIKWYSTYASIKTKNSIVERFNRTLKTRMYRAFTARGSHRWVDIVQDLVKGYNESEHRSIGMPPNAVNKRNEKVVRKILFPKKTKKIQKAEFKIDDTVRITRKKATFQKGYEQTYSFEVFKIAEIKKTYPLTYGLQDYKGEEIKGGFYTNEIQLVDKSDNIWPIEKIVRKRKKRNGTVEYLVKFKGYSDDANTWIPHTELYDL